LVVSGPYEPQAIHDLSHAALAGIQLQAFRNVTIDVNVAVQREPKTRTHRNQILQIEPAKQSIIGMRKVQGAETSSWFEQPLDLDKPQFHVRKVPQRIAA